MTPQSLVSDRRISQCLDDDEEVLDSCGKSRSSHHGEEKHIDSRLKPKYTAKDMGTLGFEDSDVKSFLLLNRVFRVGVDQIGQYFGFVFDLRQDQLVKEGRRSPIFKKEEATRYRSAEMILSYLVKTD